MNIHYSNTLGESFQTYANVSIDGVEISRENHIQVKIVQKLLTHNYFEFLCPSEAFAEKNSYPLTNTQKLHYASFSVQLIRFNQTMAIFEGIITGVKYLSQDGYPYILLTGEAATNLMDQNINCQTFINNTLKEIVTKVTSKYNDNRLQVLISPETTEILPYTVCYNETDFQFLKRLAKRYGEYMYHNGEYFVFGKGNQKRVEICEGEDFQEYSLNVISKPQNFIRERYDLRRDVVLKQESTELSYPDQKNLFHFKSVRASEKNSIQPLSGYSSPDLFYGDAQQLERAVERKKLSHESTILATAITDNPRLRLGDTMQMKTWTKEKNKLEPVESYRITEIEHSFTDKGYTNRCQGIPFEQRFTPYLDENAFPHIDSQIAIVVDNNDPESLNRLKIRFYWQKEHESTLWIPLIQGHSGAGQGAHVIPEIGHKVWVDFFGHNAEAPIVLGSLYSGNQKSGFHTKNNDLKVFQTRSGTKRIVNDEEGSIKEEDAAGSFIKFEGDGNVTLNVVKNLFIKVGENMNVLVQNDKTERINHNTNYYSKNLSNSIDDNKSERIGNYYYQESGNANIQTLKGSLLMRGTTLSVLQGGDDVKISKG
ncbi:type VI secretion system Vgr family protein [Apibacter sp. B2912]|uniref:type VI secretion system Vgr family protein n=1 Tax=Apibacter sp. B2912 TaxID=2656763 RepID=UPI00137066F2|nr:phage baseplate assembly protein V [Apibacter sp. B2912]MXO32398.1 hypothetical protein [Apibacter sp. B2912]